jgi:phosphohistidine swiveling domain-containing protein
MTAGGARRSSCAGTALPDKCFADHEAEAGAHLLGPDRADKPAHLTTTGSRSKRSSAAQRPTLPRSAQRAHSPGSTSTSPPGSSAWPRSSGTAGASTHRQTLPTTYNYRSIGLTHLVVGQSRPAYAERPYVIAVGYSAERWPPTAVAALAGLVTQRDDAVSHPAVLARELAVPAVVAVPGAMELITDGTIVEINGYTGHVRIATS